MLTSSPNKWNEMETAGMPTIIRCLTLALLVCAAWPCPAQPQAFPSKPVRLIVPYAPGGVADLMSRILAQRLAVLYNQQVVVDNRAGSAGHIGAELLLKAPADGYTIMFATTTHNAAYAMYYARAVIRLQGWRKESRRCRVKFS